MSDYNREREARDLVDAIDACIGGDDNPWEFARAALARAEAHGRAQMALELAQAEEALRTFVNRSVPDDPSTD